MERMNGKPQCLTTPVAGTSVRVGSTWWSIKCSKFRRSLSLVLVLVVVLLLTIMFSSWNVCHPDYDDGVDVQMAAAAAGSSTRRSRRSAKTCLSPMTYAGRRVDVNVDSHDDLQR